MGMAGDPRGAVVADVRHQRGHQHQRVGQQRLRAIDIHLDALDAMAAKARRRIRQQAQAVEQVDSDQRLVDVELELALARRDADRHVVPHHLGADHGQRLDLRRIDLARHDRAAGLVGRQPQFAQPGAWPAAHQADVVGDLVQRHGQQPQRAVQPHQRFVSGHRRKQVVGHHKGRVQPIGQCRRHAGAERPVGVEPGAHGGAADGQRMHVGQRAADGGFGEGQLGFVGAEFLAEGDRRGVLQVGAADLEDLGERLGLGPQRPTQARQRRQQRPCTHHRGDVHRRREHVVR